MTLDFDRIRQTADLLALVERDTTLRKSGAWYCGACPFCGGRDRFTLRSTPDGWRWYCRHCGDEKYHDAIAYVMRRENCGAKAAAEMLGGAADFRHASHAPRPVLSPSVAVPKLNQSAALEVVRACEAELWADRCLTVREWLQGRGLTEDTLRHWRVGYCATGKRDQYGREIAGLWIPRGVVFPCIVAGVVWYLKIRLMSGVPFQCSGCRRVVTITGECQYCGEKNKYRGVRGNVNALFGADTLKAQSAAVLCEGESDALLLAQEAGDVVGVATLGSASARLDLSRWAQYWLPLTRLLVAYDVDAAGRAGAADLVKSIAKARAVSVPNGKDITEYWQTGGDVRGWIAGELARHGVTGIADIGKVANRRGVPVWITGVLGEMGYHVAAQEGERLRVERVAA